MRILIIHNYYKQYGGEDKAVDELVDLLIRKGHSVYRLFRNNREIGKQKILDVFKNAYYSRETAAEAAEVIRSFEPDIAHVHNVYPLISPGIYEALQEHRVPVLQTVHNYRFICPNGLLFNKGQICTLCLEKKSCLYCGLHKCYHGSRLQSFWYADILTKAYRSRLFEKISRFAAVSEFVKSLMVKKGFGEDKISVLPNSTRGSEVSPDYRKEDYILYIGRLSDEKGIMTLLRAMEGLNIIKLIIAGDGNMKDKILQYAAEKGMKHVECIGFRQGPEKEELISRARAVVVPSEWYEPFGLAAIEAFSLETPVVVSRIGGLQSIVEENYNGLSFEPGNSTDLKEKLEFLISNPGSFHEMSCNAYRTYREKYTQEVFYSNLMSLYSELLK